MNKRRDRIQQVLSVALICAIALLTYACANIASPNGGPYDEEPPKFIASTPVPNATNYKGKKIQILFDELIQLDNPSDNVIITPPQRQLPIIRASGKKVEVELVDTLKEDMTYTFDFTSSIADNNEKNILENYTFAFSTGDVVDSMEVSGYLLNAENLEPMPNISIGLHSNLADSAFTTIPFERTSKTNDKGHFTVRNIKPGTYRIYAINDLNRDYKFDQAAEDIAFLDSVIVTSCMPDIRQDTIWRDSLTIDTIKSVAYTHYYPDNILLRLFKEKFERQYMTRPERLDSYTFTLHFNAPMDTVPVPEPLNFTPNDSAWFLPQLSVDKKDITYWIKDSLIWKQDTLQMLVTYPKSDSLNMLVPQTDTVKTVVKRRPKEKKKKKDVEEIVFLNMDIAASGEKNLYDTISVTFSEPVLDLKKECFKLEQKVDTIASVVDFNFYPDTLNPLKYYILRKWKYGEAFRLSIDSAAITSLYGKWNNSFESQFKIKTEDSYGHLYINVVGLDTVPAFVDLLNAKDELVRRVAVKKGGALFMDLKPDTYYARIILDANGNGIWDTGKYSEKLQPEEVFYCPKAFSVMQNFQVEETWNIRETPLVRQKPLDITKNKPKDKTKKKRDYREEGRSRKSSSSSSMGLGGLSL